MMELGQDWIHFKKFLHPKSKSSKNTDGKNINKGIVVIQNQNKAIRVISETDDIAVNAGTPMDEILSHLSSDKKGAVIDKSKIDMALKQALSVDKVYQQIDVLKSHLKPDYGKFEYNQTSLLLKALEGFWSKVLPSQYGVYIRLEGGTSQSKFAPTDYADDMSSKDFLILFKKGKVDQFDDPDLSSISHDRQKDAEQVIKVLRERYSVPIQGFVMDRRDWVDWCARVENGEWKAVWRQISLALRQNRIQLAPFRWSVASMIGARGVFGL